ncbi:MAG: class I SAM-dependent methyltransferase [Betaproteobacteria bacterium]|nr:class I SAM-dependent methyltransferase [Betaproteobacteria bacterium]
MSLVWAVQREVKDLSTASAFEASSRGPVARYLRRTVESLQRSEYFPGAASGTFVGGIQCQDLQALSFRDAAFDLCTSTEVMEQVADDGAAFRELHRVLRPGGVLAFTVPITGSHRTVERARLSAGQITHILPPAFHGDRLTGTDSVLVFRDYGLDIVERVQAAGFGKVKLVTPDRNWFGHLRKVVVAKK